tara:strand:- start:274 stop:462 length:189 start_codon:yes stop_codon:yes gene_type:complete
MTLTDNEIMLKIESDLILNMGVALIKQGCPDDTEMFGFDMTLGEFKKIAKLSQEEITLLMGK